MSEEFVSISKAEYEKLLADSKAIAESRKAKKKNYDTQFNTVKSALQRAKNDYDKLRRMNPISNADELVMQYASYNQASSYSIIPVYGDDTSRIMITHTNMRFTWPDNIVTAMISLHRDDDGQYDNLGIYFYDEEAVKAVHSERLEHASELVKHFEERLEKLIAEEQE